jgi:hypothetical protein
VDNAAESAMGNDGGEARRGENTRHGSGGSPIVDKSRRGFYGKGGALVFFLWWSWIGFPPGRWWTGFRPEPGFRWLFVATRARRGIPDVGWFLLHAMRHQIQRTSRDLRG